MKDTWEILAAAVNEYLELTARAFWTREEMDSMRQKLKDAMIRARMDIENREWLERAAFVAILPSMMVTT